MSLPDSNRVTNSEPIRRFAESVEGYCSLIGDCDSLSFSTFIVQLAEALAALHKDGFSLPDVEPTTTEIGPRLTPEELSRIINCVHEKLTSAVQYYKDHGTDEEYLATILLSDDLSDLYQDVKAALTVFKRGSDDDVRNAVWEWHFGFMGHYGRHMVNAIHTVHLMRCDSLHYIDEN